jgi:predicted RNA-binding protein with PIN domain
MTVVFDGWLGGWSTEKMEKKRELEIIYSRLGEKADEVIKRLVREKGSEAVVITSDQEISRFGERLNVAVIPSEKFVEKLTTSSDRFEESLEEEGGEGRIHRKGLARRPSKREKRARAALKKL